MITTSGTLQNAAAATGNGTPLALAVNEASCTLTVSGTFVGTLTFEGTEDGTNWVALLAQALGSASAPASTATAPGTFALAVTDLVSIRARVSAYTSGSITVTGHASDLPYTPVGGASGGGGGGAVTVADGADVAQGTTTDAATVNTVIGRLKKLVSLLPAALGSTTGANSLPVVIASDQGAVAVTAAAGTNLNTSALALEAGHLANLDTHTPALGQAAMAASTPVAIASNQSTVPVNSQAGAKQTPTGAAAMTANADNSYTFSPAVNHVYVQNKSASDIYVEWDAAASLGTSVVPANKGAYLFDIPCTVLHIWPTAATAVNGAADLNIVARGWA